MWLVKGFTFDRINIISIVKRNGSISDNTSLGSKFLAGSYVNIIHTTSLLVTKNNTTNITNKGKEDNTTNITITNTTNTTTNNTNTTNTKTIITHTKIKYK